jgi:hypothetical protein
MYGSGEPTALMTIRSPSMMDTANPMLGIWLSVPIRLVVCARLRSLFNSGHRYEANGMTDEIKVLVETRLTCDKCGSIPVETDAILSCLMNDHAITIEMKTRNGEWKKTGTINPNRGARPTRSTG